MSQASIKKKGYLSKLPVKGLVKKWNRRWFVLHATSHEGVVRLEYYDSEEYARSDVGKRTIPLRDSTAPSIAVGNKLHPYVFQLKTQIGHHTLAADSHPELDDWMDSIKQAVQEDRLKRRRTKAQSKVIASPSDDSSFQSLNESGMSYKNHVDSGTYRVTVEENETSVKMNLSGTYSLELTPTMMILKAPSSATIFTLSYKYLKNYGKQSGQFHFVTGKFSPLGEGKLIFVTTCSKEIFGVVHNNIKKLRESAQRNPPEQKNQTSEPKPQNPGQQVQTQPVARPAPQKPVQPPPPPQTKKQPKTSIGGTNSRPGSRHSGEVLDTSIAGTYRTSRDLEEGGAIKEEAEKDTGPTYATVDYSKKTSARQKQQAASKMSAQTEPQTKQPDAQASAVDAQASAQFEEAIYSEPYEEDPAYKLPLVPSHQKPHNVRDSRASCALVEIEDNAFFDSFDDDDGDDVNDSNLQPLTEGASNPLDDFTDFNTDYPGSNNDIETAEEPAEFTDFSNPGGNEASVPVATTKAATNSTGIMKNLESLDFGFGPGNLEPQTTSGAGGSTEPPKEGNAENVMNFDFNFGNEFLTKDDPFSSNMPAMGAAGTGNFAEFDLGKLDANFFEKLEAFDVTDQPSGFPPNAAWGTGAEDNPMSPQELDKFWTDMNSSAPKT